MQPGDGCSYPKKLERERSACIVSCDLLGGAHGCAARIWVMGRGSTATVVYVTRTSIVRVSCPEFALSLFPSYKILHSVSA